MDEAILAVRALKVRESYRKKYYPEAGLEWTISEDVERGLADVSINVHEGKRVRVRNITFRGNRKYSAWSLRNTMKQKRVNIFSFLTGRGSYSEADLEADLLFLRKRYVDDGYHEADIGSPEIEQRPEGHLRIVIPIEEGKQYTLRLVRGEGVTLFPGKVESEAVLVKPGDIAGQAALDNTARSIQDFYGRRGYIDTRVGQAVAADAESGQLDIVYRVEEGTRSTIRNIEIKGNWRTKDKVIRRELTILTSEIINEVKVRQSERRLRNTRFFSFVQSTPRPTGVGDEYDLIFEIEEQRSGQFAVGAGFSSIDEIVGFLELSQGNFDIANWPRFTGGGQKFKARLQLGTARRDWSLNYTEPWFLDRRLSLGLEIFQHEREFLSDDYDQLNTGGGITVVRPLAGPYRLSLAYSLQEVEVRNVDESASQEIRAEAGVRTKSSTKLSLIRDTRNYSLLATRGSRTVASGGVAGGVLGGETDLYELQLRSTHFFPLWYEHVLNLRGRVTAVEEYGDSSRVPIFDRLFLGGARTLRGFDFREVGPKDENAEPIGGKTEAYATVEYTVPIVEQVRAAAIIDAGVVNWDPYDFNMENYNSIYGIGVRFDLPGFPLQLDYSWPLQTDEFNDSSSGRFNFLVGYQSP